MDPTDSQIAFRLRKLRTKFARFDVDKDGYMSKEDFELMAKKMIEMSNATGEQAESCRQIFMHVPDTFGFTPGMKLSREEAAKNMNEAMLKLSWKEQRAMCDNFYNVVFDAMDLDRDDHISLEEYKTYTRVLAPDLSDEDKVKCFNLIDADQDGKISRAEFLEVAFGYLHKFEENEFSELFYGPLVH
jgi:Ca2+-binding EF-hand superfamily protein